MMPGQWKQPCIVIGAFLICGFFSSNALANDDGDYKPKEARAEIRLGYATSDLIFDDGDAFAAVALGYDKTIIGSLFIGVEGAVERSLEGSFDPVPSGGVRIGLHRGRLSNIYIQGGYSAGFIDGYYIETGSEIGLISSLYGKLNYRKVYRENEANLDIYYIGLGYKF